MFEDLKITVVGGGISLEPDTAPDALMMENEDFIVTDDEVKFISQEQTVGELDHLTLEDGGQIIIEEESLRILQQINLQLLDNRTLMLMVFIMPQSLMRLVRLHLLKMINKIVTVL